MSATPDGLVQLALRPQTGAAVAGLSRNQTKVLLTRCPVVVPNASLCTGVLCPPVGLAYLAATARDRDYDVTVLDPLGEAPHEVHEIPGRNARYYGWSLDAIIEAIPPDTKYIGVACMFSHEWPLSKELLKAIRGRLPKATIIIGGEHATATPEANLRDCPSVDFVVLGEGEETFVDLLDTLGRGEAASNVPGVFFLRDSQAIRTKPRERMRGVDAIPRPAWDLVPVENFLANGLSYGVSNGRTMPIVATRGCPYQCTFCSSPTMWTTRWYARSPKDVVDEIESYAKKYRANNFDFYDLTAILKRDWIKEFCQELIDRNLNITWQLPAGTRSEAIDEEVARLLALSGHRNLVYAPETGSEAMLKAIKKRVNLGRMTQSMKGAIKNGISIKLNMIFGFPEDTRGDILRSLVFLAKMAWLGVDDVFISTFVPYPGSELFDGLQKKGYIQKLDDDYYYGLIAYGDAKNVRSFSEYLGSRELGIYRVGGLLLFYGLSYLLRPQRFVQTAWHLWRRDHRTRIEKALDTFLNSVTNKRPRGAAASMSRVSNARTGI